MGGDSRILVLYTGGTIGMLKNEQGVLAPAAGQFEPNIRGYPHLHDQKYAERAILTEDDGDPTRHIQPLVLPDTKEAKRVIYKVVEYDPLLDSSNMKLDDYQRMAKDIKNAYHFYDGFVILHGTDTLAYTASALSFMLENLGKSVIITGSQIPLFETLTDGRDNFIAALVIAGNYNIPEVTVFFNHLLLRGNRTTKVSATTFDAFNSHNMRPLATVGINIVVKYRDIFRPSTIEKFNVHLKMNTNVGVLRLFPSISTATVRSFLQPPIQGVVLQSYGAGNIPDNRKDIMDEINEAVHKRKVIIVNITQCPKGSVAAAYATGKILLDAGVIPGADMTTEAALTKLSYILSKDEWDLKTKKEKLMQNLRGELTVAGDAQMDPKKDMGLIAALSKALHLSSAREIEHLKRFIFPCLMCTAAKTGDIRRLEELVLGGADPSGADYDGRTALHVAGSEGNVEAVKYLLEQGSSVHARDRNGRTPLVSTMNHGQAECAKLMVKAGAHLVGNMGQNPALLGEYLCRAATVGKIRVLRAFTAGGVSMTTPDWIKNTAVHAAVMGRQKEALHYILNNAHDARTAVDMFGRTAEDVAKVLGFDDMLDVLNGTGSTIGSTRGSWTG